MELNSLEINTSGSLGNIILNGEDISKKITKVEYVHEGGEIPFIKLTYPVDEIKINANVIVNEIPDNQNT
ncbi:MAG: hypothetical protein ACOCNB_06285 [Acetivibrio ethanolgignens]